MTLENTFWPLFSMLMIRYLTTEGWRLITSVLLVQFWSFLVEIWYVEHILCAQHYFTLIEISRCPIWNPKWPLAFGGEFYRIYNFCCGRPIKNILTWSKVEDSCPHLVGNGTWGIAYVCNNICPIQNSRWSPWPLMRWNISGCNLCSIWVIFMYLVGNGA